jgi:hypothetical protein
MQWFPKIQASGTGLALVTSFAPTLGYVIPYPLRIAGFTVGLFMLAWPLLAYGVDLLRRAQKMWLVVGMIIGCVVSIGCALALYLGPEQRQVTTNIASDLLSDQEKFRRSMVLSGISSKWVDAHPSANPEIFAGLQDPPDDYVNSELAKIGETWNFSSQIDQ